MMTYEEIQELSDQELVPLLKEGVDPAWKRIWFEVIEPEKKLSVGLTTASHSTCVMSLCMICSGIRYLPRIKLCIIHSLARTGREFKYHIENIYTRTAFSIERGDRRGIVIYHESPGPDRRDHKRVPFLSHAWLLNKFSCDML